jgi:nucleotide-binding universal stress UspA family protein
MSTDLEVPMSKTVLVGVDHHPTARDAVVLGATLASAANDELAVAHIYPLDPMADRLVLGAPGANPLREEAKAIVERAIAGIAPDARTIVAPARSVAAGLHLQAAGERAELIVVGSSHRGAIGRAAIGTQSTRIVQGAPCAVAIAPRGLAEAGLALRDIAVAVDGSDEAADALDFARRLAERTSAQLRLVTVQPPLLADWGRYRYVPAHAGDDAYARKEAERTLAVARPDEKTEIRSGAVAGALIDVSSEVDLLVMGSRSYGPVRRLLLGGVSDLVVRASDCPVVVLPRSARTEDAGPPATTAAAATT